MNRCLVLEVLYTLHTKKEQELLKDKNVGVKRSNIYPGFRSVQGLIPFETVILRSLLKEKKRKRKYGGEGTFNNSRRNWNPDTS